jgi:hypothetical protein
MDTLVADRPRNGRAWADAFVGRAVSLGRRFHPVSLATCRHRAHQRERAEHLLASLSRTSEAKFEGTVLVDATWDNPNYWLRYALVRSALGLAAGSEVGLLGPYHAGACRRTLERFGIRATLDGCRLYGPLRLRRQEVAKRLAGVKTPDELLGWKWPSGFPPSVIYDGLLKRQRAPSVRLDHPRLMEDLAEAIGALQAAERILDHERFDLVVLSHAINFQCAALGWLAASRGIPVVVLYGDHGVARFVRLRAPQDIFDTVSRPSLGEFLGLDDARARLLERAGAVYLEKRVSGQTADLGGILAFQRSPVRISRAKLCGRFGWDPRRRIVGVYLSSWFDFPHVLGMANFRDFYDWFEATCGVAARQPHVNWLFKAHPSEARYGGAALREVFPALGPPHVRLAPKEWNGAGLIDAVDALVTYHGTSGLEYAAAGKPILLADRGWYHEFGIGRWCRTREAYLSALTQPWWEGIDLREAARRARILAGWCFGRPAWQRGFVLEDDSVQHPIYRTMPRLLSDHGEEIEQEIDTIRRWFDSGDRHYHMYKMRAAESVVG